MTLGELSDDIECFLNLLYKMKFVFNTINTLSAHFILFGDF